MLPTNFTIATGETFSRTNYPGLSTNEPAGATQYQILAIQQEKTQATEAI